MITIHLRAQEEYRWKGEHENPAPASFPAGLLYHQWRTYVAEEPIIVNSMNTGTGKTKAALLRMLKRARGSQKLSPTRDNVLLIAPTNELIRQHVADAQRFCQENDLPYRVNPLTKEQLDRFIADYRASLPGLPTTRRAADLVHFLRDSSDLDLDFSKQADLWVVNPDIFHYALTFGYNPLDRSQMFNAFFTLFNYIIVDEFHYYDAKQLATFLFFMKYSQRQGYISHASTQRQFCLLTATPRPAVRRYLERLGEKIAWIEPDAVAPEDQAYVEPVCALAPVCLRVYSTDELQKQGQVGGLLQLVEREREAIRQWSGQMREGEPVEGAIISNAKGKISLIHQALLRSGVGSQRIGCITGAEKSARRQEATEKALILATPTVDLGYNFERSYQKRRQNIDFLFFDADFQDEFIQRLGRAGRVLGKQIQAQESEVYAVVDSACYELLRPCDQAILERSRLNDLLKNVPTKNELEAYIRTGAIMGLFPAFVGLHQGMSDEEQQLFAAFVEEMLLLFGGKVRASTQASLLKKMQGMARCYEAQHACYGQLRLIPKETFMYLHHVLKNRRTTEQGVAVPSRVEAPLKAFEQRLRACHEKTLNGALEWLYNDLCQYTIEKARLNFREGFQPPLALVHDPKELHSREEIAVYNALHFVRYYTFTAYTSFAAWQQSFTERREQSVLTDRTIDTTAITAYFRLHTLRDEPLQIALCLDKRDETRTQWEERCAYRLTALHGLEIVAAKENHGLPREIRELFREQLIVAFVARNDPGYQSWKEIYRLQKQARLYPMVLTVDFSDVGKQQYVVVLGTMAFHACAEISAWAKASDLGKAQREDDAPFIC